MVIIDPLMAYLGGDVNSHRDQDVRRALAPLARMAEETGAAVILVRHNTKGGGSNALYRGGGSIGIIGAARLGFTFARDPEDEGRVIVACTKANITSTPPSLAYVLSMPGPRGCARVECRMTAKSLRRRGPTGRSRRSRPKTAPTVTTPPGGCGAYLLDNGGEAEAADVFKAGEGRLPEGRAPACPQAGRRPHGEGGFRRRLDVAARRRQRPRRREHEGSEERRV